MPKRKPEPPAAPAKPRPTVRDLTDAIEEANDVVATLDQTRPLDDIEPGLLILLRGFNADHRRKG